MTTDWFGHKVKQKKLKEEIKVHTITKSKISYCPLLNNPKSFITSSPKLFTSSKTMWLSKFRVLLLSSFLQFLLKQLQLIHVYLDAVWFIFCNDLINYKRRACVCVDLMTQRQLTLWVQLIKGEKFIIVGGYQIVYIGFAKHAESVDICSPVRKTKVNNWMWGLY